MPFPRGSEFTCGFGLLISQDNESSSNSKRNFLRGLMAGAAVSLPVAAAKAEDANAVASSRMSYSRFLEYLDMGRVKKVNPIKKSDVC